MSVEEDILEFLSKVDGLRFEDRKALLTLLVNKHVVLSSAPLIMGYEDLELILSMARNIYVATPAPLFIPDRKGDGVELSTAQFNQYCLIESVVSFLNSKDGIKRLPKFKKGRK